MKKLLALCLMMFTCVFAYKIADSLSADAVGMAIGILFGILAGIPTSLLVLAASRRRPEDVGQAFNRSRLAHNAYLQYPPSQPPWIILTGGQPQQYGGQQHMRPAPPLVNTLPAQGQQGQFVNLENQQDDW